jgi:hypothetical protein
MNSLFIESTNYTPGVKFTSEGKLTIYGKSLMEDTALFYQPLIQWINDCTLKKIEFVIKVDYLNTSSSQQISKLLLLAKDNPKIQDYIVNWYYEIEDEAGLDFGKELEYITDFQFNFLEYSVVEV